MKKIPYDPQNPQHKLRKIHQGTAYDHTLSALRQSTSNDPITNISILLHDIQKPIVKHYNEVGRVKYIGHDDARLGLVDKIADRLKFSNKEKEAILFSLSNHMMGHDLDKVKTPKLIELRQSPYWDVLKSTIWADEMARGAPLSDPVGTTQKFNKVEDIIKKFGEKQAFEKRMSAMVDGRLIMTLRPDVKGADIGKVKDATREWIMNKDWEVTPEQVKEYIQSYEL